MPSPQPSYVRVTAAAISIPSSCRNSPLSTPSHYNGSLQSTPEGMVPISSSLPLPSAFALPESLVPPPTSTPPTSSPSAMAEVVGKGPGLIRRVSRGAQGIPSKFRRNGSNAHRDKSSGPVIMRRRSDSRSAIDGGFDMSDLDLNLEEEEAIDDFYGEPINALGISSSRPSVSSIPDSAVVAPVRNSRLEQGTLLKKVTRKDKKEINLRLDLDSAKVFWDPSRPSKAFYIDDVKEIRSGPDAKHYREECDHTEIWEPYWFTIVYSDSSRSKGRIKTMHLIAPDKGIFNMWTQTLDSVSRNRIDLMAGLLGFAEKSAKLVWQREMTKRFHGNDHLPEDEYMDLPGIIQLCRSLHINCSESTLRDYFEKADSNRTGSLNQAQFLYFVRRLKERKDIKKIYKSYLSEHATEMDRDVFFSFLSQEQGVKVDADLEHWSATFEKFARATKPKSTPSDGGEIPLPAMMNFSAFQLYLTSPANSIFKPVSPNVRLDRPLNEYFISSSHNTYLLGRQVAGESSTEAYITALQKGCRCIEIDCWDGGDGKPIVMHGRTLTKSISFQDTIKVINKYAFAESPYPLTLSLEVHCCPDQQAQMVKTMIKEFGDKLVLQPLDWESTVLPTPEELKYRILIKVKGPAEELDVKALANELSNRKRDRSFSSPWSRPVQLNDSVIPNSPLVSSPPSMSPPERAATFWASPRTSTTSTNNTVPTSALISSAEDSDSPHATAAEDKDKKNKTKKSKTSNITKILGDLGVYTCGIKFTDFKNPESNTFNHVFSFNERTFDRLTKPGAQQKQLLEEHNMRCLMRVYPASHRINSSNFEPLRFWRRGVQMAALNWQTYDLGQQLNEAMFAGGDDRTGYVLKPAELRLEEPSPVVGHKRAPKKEVRFKVQIISAQQLPRPRGLSTEANINPYVEFEMHCAEDMGPNATGVGGQDASARNGHSGIGNPLRKRTRIVEGNGYNPEFPEDEIEMKVTTRYPSLVFVRWTVWNSLDARTTDRAPLATFTAKLDSIQQGYRHLPLFDSNGEQYLFSTLFCYIKKLDTVDARPEAIPEGSSSRRSSMEPISPLQEANGAKSSRNFMRRLINRAPSERKKRNKEGRIGSESNASDELLSRSSTLER
ncbi:1-phosphatidylinositol-4,5-bisphosphate phosphodiesterase 1 [Corynespora cassiicola Philippines]|uniref:Phosphoinositide phospholipase C n=1 Tax=Corynespora cassiicola Philippines TaxID=1448308 RepID=A0A2T2NL31_CORCC|nr:1-phosphatidylinositol-4,5-bisphosphate phosphodiesterase 1 [Corynespora cassiicola Philippines]